VAREEPFLESLESIYAEHRPSGWAYTSEKVPISASGSVLGVQKHIQETDGESQIANLHFIFSVGQAKASFESAFLLQPKMSSPIREVCKATTAMWATKPGDFGGTRNIMCLTKDYKCPPG